MEHWCRFEDLTLLGAKVSVSAEVSLFGTIVYPGKIITTSCFVKGTVFWFKFKSKYSSFDKTRSRNNLSRIDNSSKQRHFSTHAHLCSQQSQIFKATPVLHRTILSYNGIFYKWIWHNCRIFHNGCILNSTTLLNVNIFSYYYIRAYYAIFFYFCTGIY